MENCICRFIFTYK